MVFPGLFRPSSLFSAAPGDVSASVPHDVERTVAGSSTVAQGEDSASESLSVVTRSVVESVLDVGPAGVPSTFEPGESIMAGISLLADVDGLGFEAEQLSVAFLSPYPGTSVPGPPSIVLMVMVLLFWDPVDVAVQTE